MFFDIIDNIKYHINNTFLRVYYYYYKKRINRLNKRKLNRDEEDVDDIQLKKIKINL